MYACGLRSNEAATLEITAVRVVGRRLATFAAARLCHAASGEGCGHQGPQLLGHVHIEMSAGYVHFTEPTRASLKAILNKLMPGL